jgi:hypothetical protein
MSLSGTAKVLPPPPMLVFQPSAKADVLVAIKEAVQDVNVSTSSVSSLVMTARQDNIINM